MDYFIVDLVKEVDMVASAKITKEMNFKFSDLCSAVGCFRSMFTLQVKESAKPYQTPFNLIYI